MRFQLLNHPECHAPLISVCKCVTVNIALLILISFFLTKRQVKIIFCDKTNAVYKTCTEPGYGQRNS